MVTFCTASMGTPEPIILPQFGEFSEGRSLPILLQTAPCGHRLELGCCAAEEIFSFWKPSMLLVLYSSIELLPELERVLVY